MDTIPLTGPRRRFAGRRALPGARENGLAVLAEALLSAEPSGNAVPEPPGASPSPAALEVAAPVAREADIPPAEPLRGVYVLVPAGIEPDERRRTALAVACRLAPPARPTAVFLFHDGLADAHILGEVACGRLGPQNYLASADTGHMIATLRSQCEQVGIILLDPPNGELERLGQVAQRAVFVARPDAESVVETYRELKVWRAAGAKSEAALFVVGTAGAGQAGRLHRRLRIAVRRFLGWDLAIQGYLASDATPAGPDRPEPLRVLSQAPAEEIWPWLLSPAAGDKVPRASAALVAPAPVAVAPDRPAAGAAVAGADVAAVFSLWSPATQHALLAVIESQVPSLVAGDLRQIFRVEVDEPDAPPLAAVRDDGALVAILLADRAAPLDTSAAETWLVRHRSLLARAYPSSRISPDAAPAAIVLAPLEPGPATDGIRRFLPVKAGGQRGIVFLP